MKDNKRKLFTKEHIEEYGLFYGFICLIGMATIAAIIGIILGHYFGNYDRPYRTFEDYQYQQYLNKDFQ